MVDCRYTYTLGMTVLLLIGALGTFVGPTLYYNQFRTGGTYFEQRDYDFDLTEDSPIFTLEEYHPVISIEITSLLTNDVPVELEILVAGHSSSNKTTTLYLITTTIENSSVITEFDYFSEMELVIKRADSDATGTIGIVLELVAPVIDILVPAYPVLFALLAMIFSIYKLFKIALDCWVPVKGYLMRGSPVAVVLLVLLGTLMIFPLADTSSSSGLEPTISEYILHQQDYSFTINETRILNLTEILSDRPNTDFVQIESVNLDGGAVSISVVRDGTHDTTLSNLTSFDGQLIIHSGHVESLEVLLDSVDVSDMDFYLNLIDERLEYVMPVVSHSILAAVGLTLIVVAFWWAWQADRSLSRDSY